MSDVTTSDIIRESETQTETLIQKSDPDQLLHTNTLHYNLRKSYTTNQKTHDKTRYTTNYITHDKTHYDTHYIKNYTTNYITHYHTYYIKTIQ